MSRYSTDIYSTDPTHVYMDLTAVNSATGENSQPQFLEFSATRDIPILENCADYEMSIIKFTLGTGSLPLMIIPVQIKPPYLDVNTTPYSITMEYNGQWGQRYMVFKPQNVSAPVPPLSTVSQDLSTQYYWINSYQYFISLVNETFQSAYNWLKVQTDAHSIVLPTTLVPYMEYNPNQTTQVAIINAPVTGYTPPISGDYIKIYFNNAMYNLFNSFNFFNYGNNAVDGKNYMLNVSVLPNNGNIFTVSSPTVSYAQCYQEYSTLGANSCPIESIIFMSNTIPINPTIKAQPVIYNGLNGDSNQLSNNAYTNIITDISIPITYGWEYKNSNLLYVPQGEYRMISLGGQQSLKKYDLSIYWSDHWGNTHPFLLNPNETSTLKIMFRKK